jgi:hypothetical protein
MLNIDLKGKRALVAGERPRVFARYVAIGDSSTEGLEIPMAAAAIAVGPTGSRHTSRQRSRLRCGTRTSPYAAAPPGESATSSSNQQWLCVPTS